MKRDEKIAKLLWQAVLSTIALFGYVFNLRPRIEGSLGTYFLGVTDTSITFLCMFALVFLIVSRVANLRKGT